MVRLRTIFPCEAVRRDGADLNALIAALDAIIYGARSNR
jgi:hypothetical protein